MAHGYKEVFASSTMRIPFAYTKMALQAIDTEGSIHYSGNNHEFNALDDQDFNFRGMNNVHCEAGAW
jgi:hypothetical protein